MKLLLAKHIVQCYEISIVLPLPLNFSQWRILKNMTIKLSWHIIIFFTLKLSIYRLIIFSPPQYINHLKIYYLFIYLLFWKYYLDSISCPIIFIWLGKINPKWWIGKHLLNTFQDFAVLVFRWYLQWMLVDKTLLVIPTPDMLSFYTESHCEQWRLSQTLGNYCLVVK